MATEDEGAWQRDAVKLLLGLMSLEGSVTSSANCLWREQLLSAAFL